MAVADPTFQGILEEFYGWPPGSVRVEVIHMSGAVEREGVIAALEAALGLKDLRVREAADGVAAVAAGHPRQCFLEEGSVPILRTPGEVGCLLSHVAAIKEAFADPATKCLVLFEDDCRPAEGFSLKGLREWLGAVRRGLQKFSVPDHFTDFLLLGTMGSYFSIPWLPAAKWVERFNGSHAVVLCRPFMEKVLRSYDLLLQRGRTAPVDGLYSFLLRAEKRWAVVPTLDTTFFVQDRSIPSYVIGSSGVPQIRFE